MSTPREQEQAAVDAIMARFRDGQSEPRVAWGHDQPEVPSRLYHYTDVGGLQGIIEDKGFRASDARYMNDASELVHAEEVISTEIRAVLDEPANREIFRNTDIGGVANPFAYYMTPGEPFIACFCEQDDLLSQWRAYGQSDSPVSLGVDLLAVSVFGLLPPNTYVRKVLYDEKRQRTLARDAVAGWVNTIRLLLDDGYQLQQLLPYPGIPALREALSQYRWCFKHPTFSEEREWRLTKLVDPEMELAMAEAKKFGDELGSELKPWAAESIASMAEGVKICFRNTMYGLTPYVDVPINGTAIFTDRLPLWSVTQGPRAHAALAKQSLSLYLRSVGYDEPMTEVFATSVPLRT